MKIKVKIDDATRICDVKMVKERIKQFQDLYTEGDLKRIFHEEFPDLSDRKPSVGEILNCKVSAFPSGAAYSADSVSFSITIFVDCCNNVVKLHYYMHMTEDCIYSVPKVTMFGDPMAYYKVFRAED